MIQQQQGGHPQQPPSQQLLQQQMAQVRGHSGGMAGPNQGSLDPSQQRMQGPMHQQQMPPQQQMGGPGQQSQQQPQQQQQPPQTLSALKQNRIAPVAKPQGLDPLELLKERENRYCTSLLMI